MSAPTGLHAMGTIRAAGLYLAISAVGHLLWEIAHLPLYTIGQTGSFAAKSFAVVHCTVGDVVIASWTLGVAILATRSRAWPNAHQALVAAMSVLLAVAYTGFSEWQNVYIRQAWAYAAAMPTIRVAGVAIGLSPLAQWVFVPAVSFWLVGRVWPVSTQT